jgi:ADP-heptose:LPS heptosyltransferase
VILLLRALGVGDLATAVPALRGLRRAFPGQHIQLAAPGWLAPLVELTGAVDELLPVAGLDGCIRWPSPSPQLAVNLHGRGPESHWLLHTADPKQLFGFACQAAGYHLGPVWRADEHEVARWCRMLRWYGIATDPTDLALAVPEGPTGLAGVTIVHPGAKLPERRWPASRYGEVARALAAAGHRVVVTGSDEEPERAARVAAAAGLPDSAVLAGRTDLRQLAGLVARARLVVSGDTGIGHLASAYGTPSVLLFGPTPPEQWGPPDRPVHRVLWRGPTGLGQITVPEVVTAAEEVVELARG